MQSTNTLSKTVTVSLRITEPKKHLYEAAAKQLGLTFTDFMKKSFDDLAEKAIQDSLIARLKKLQAIFDRAGIPAESITWAKILDAAEWFPNEQIEILETRSDEDVKNYLSMAMKRTA